MRFKGQQSARLPEVQFTSMIDIVFLLLCFFIATSIFSQWEYEVDVILPTAQSGKLPERMPGEVIINLTRDGRLVINQQEFTAEQLEKRLAGVARYFPGQPIILRGDREVEYDHVIRVIDICRRADIWNISFATSGDDEASSSPTSQP